MRKPQAPSPTHYLALGPLEWGGVRPISWPPVVQSLSSVYLPGTGEAVEIFMDCVQTTAQLVNDNYDGHQQRQSLGAVPGKGRPPCKVHVGGNDNKRGRAR